MDRRRFVTTAAALVFGGLDQPAALGVSDMYGLIGKMIAVEGRRETLIDILLQGIAGMPGCLSYIVAKDAADPNAIWITEVWDSEASHKASLQLPSVKSAIGRGKPLIESFGDYFTTEPVGGIGLSDAE